MKLPSIGVIITFAVHPPVDLMLLPAGWTTESSVFQSVRLAPFCDALTPKPPLPILGEGEGSSASTIKILCWTVGKRKGLQKNSGIFLSGINPGFISRSGFTKSVPYGQAFTDWVLRSLTSNPFATYNLEYPVGPKHPQPPAAAFVEWI
jgi:hypothetical protein